MDSVTVVTAIADWFEDVTGLTVRSGSSMGDSLEDTPLMDVYAEAWEPAEETGRTRKTTFGGAVQPVTVTVHADLYAEDAAWLGQRMAAVQKYADLLIAELRKIKAHPIMSQEDVIRLTWRASRAAFLSGEVSYAGVRFVFEVTYK